jgi:DNA recombination protein RmuC
MDVLVVVALACGLVLGIAVGAVAALFVARSRGDSQAAAAQAVAAEARSDIAQARAEAAQARVEAAQARSELARGAADLAESHAAVADARAEAAAAQAEASHTAAQMAAAVAERAAAVQRAEELLADRESMLNQFRVLSGETLERQGRLAEQQAELRLKATEQLMAPVRESLERFSARLTDVEKERVEMTTSLRAQVQAVQLTGETLRRETAALVTALRKPQVRGSWGETQLKRVAEIAGMLERCDFDLQHTVTADDRQLRPDMRVHLAEGKHVFVDSKVPLTSFLEAHETDDLDLRQERLRHYARSVRTHIDQLSAKEYWKAPGSPEFVVLFLPSEAFLSEALAQAPDLYDYAAARNIVLATPGTLIGLLRAVAFSWRQTALAESAAEVFRLGRDLHHRLGSLGNRLDKLGRALRSSVNAYNETIATAEGSVLVGARRFRDLSVTDEDLKALSSIDEPVRQIQAPELVEDAVQVEPLVGRAVRRARPREAIPEAAHLTRPAPDLLDLVECDLDQAEGLSPDVDEASG